MVTAFNFNGNRKKINVKDFRIVQSCHFFIKLQFLKLLNFMDSKEVNVYYVFLKLELIL